MSNNRVFVQKLLNYYPLWSRARTDNNSITGQFFSAFGEFLDELNDGITDAKSTRFPQLMDMWKAEMVYFLSLPKDFSFVRDSSDPYHVRYLPPVATGTEDGETYNITAIDDVEQFMNSAPTSFELEEETTFSFPDITTITTSKKAEIFSLDVTPTLTGQIYIKVTNGTEFYAPNFFNSAYVTVVGIHEADTGDIYEQKECSETVYFDSNTAFWTTTRFKKITQVVVGGFSAGTTIQLSSVWPNHTPVDLKKEGYVYHDRAPVDLYLSVYDASEEFTAVEQQELTVNPMPNPVFALMHPISDTIYDYNPEFDIIYNAALTTTEDAVSFFHLPFTTLYAVVGQATLSLFSYVLPYNPMRIYNYTSENIGQQLVLVRSDYAPGDTVRINVTRAHPLTKVMGASLTLEYENGNKYTIKEDGSVVDFDATYRLNLLPVEQPIIITPPEEGSANVILTSAYYNKPADSDSRSIQINRLTPIITYNLAEAGINTSIDGCFMDSDQHIWLTSGTTMYRVRPRYDIMLVDYNMQTAVFRENYDEVEVVNE